MAVIGHKQYGTPLYWEGRAKFVCGENVQHLNSPQKLHRTTKFYIYPHCVKGILTLTLTNISQRAARRLILLHPK